ncbi:SAP18-domain-containing protein [Meredithblackwellia eburnea MCA 4105]
MDRRGGRLRIDREKTCPFLLRTFVKPHQHHSDADYSIDRLPFQNEHQLYVWMDSSIRELLILLRDASPPLRVNPLARFSVRVVYFDTTRDQYRSRDLGLVTARDLTSTSNSASVAAQRSSQAAERTLDDFKFVIGDYIDVAVLAPSMGQGGMNPSFAPGFGGRGPPSGPIGGLPGGSRGSGPVGPSRTGGFGGGGDFQAGPGESRPLTAQEAWGRPHDVRGAGGGGWRGGRGGGGSGGVSGAGRGGAPGRGPADSGWGRRLSQSQGGDRRDAGDGDRSRNGRDAPPHQRRRSSRSISPRRGQDRRSRSPLPEKDMDTR